MGEALSGHIQRIGNAGKAFADDSLQVAEFLTTLGLYFDLSDSDKSVTQALVSLDPLLLVRYREAEDDQATIGRLFGYPETAIKAFAEGEDKLLPVEEADIHISEAGLSHSFVGFRLSKAYWREELAVVRQWQEILLAYGLINPTQ